MDEDEDEDEDEDAAAAAAAAADDDDDDDDDDVEEEDIFDCFLGSAAPVGWVCVDVCVGDVWLTRGRSASASSLGEQSANIPQ